MLTLRPTKALAAAQYAAASALVLLVVSGCGGTGEASPQPQANENQGVSTAQGLTGDPFVACLDQLGIPYRVTELPDGGFKVTPVGESATDPRIATCAAGTGETSDDGQGAAESNLAIRAIADCLVEAGWHATIVEDPSTTYGDGTVAVGYSVPGAERSDGSFLADQTSCTEKVSDQ